MSGGSQVGFTITLRDASGNELRNRLVQLTSSQPSIAVVAPNTNTSTVLVGGVAVGTTELTLQALNANGQPEGTAESGQSTATLLRTRRQDRPAWRERLSDEQNRASLEADLRHKLGNQTFELLESLADSLSEQKLGGLALAYLRERLRER